MISDWAATNSTIAPAVGGLDLVMPGPDGRWSEALVSAVRAGQVPQELIDDKVLRLLRLARNTSRLGEQGAPAESMPTQPSRSHGPASPTQEEFALLRDAPRLLPLAADGLGSVALIGPNAVVPYLQGGGSVFVPAIRTVSFEAGLTVHWGGDSRRRPPIVLDTMLTVPGRATAPARRPPWVGGEIGAVKRQDAGPEPLALIVTAVGEDGPAEVARHDRSTPGSPQIKEEHYPPREGRRVTGLRGRTPPRRRPSSHSGPGRRPG
ncbi:hypothetical protein [Streptomyces turgidiscabies]|uniref:hypothetical protein n=1 Tax=Streptomyces turgidiscabies TaxID=85558 RepID=UPI0035902FD1